METRMVQTQTSNTLTLAGSIIHNALLGIIDVLVTENRDYVMLVICA